MRTVPITPSPNREPGLVREPSCLWWGWKGFSDQEATRCESRVGLVIAVQMDQGFQRMKKAVNDAFADSKPKAGNRARKGAAGSTGVSTPKAGANAQEKKHWADATKNIVMRYDVAMRIKTVRLGTATKIGIAGKQELGPFLCATQRPRRPSISTGLTWWSDRAVARSRTQSSCWPDLYASHLNLARDAGRDCPRPIAGRSFRPSRPPLSRGCLRSAIPGYAGQPRRLLGHGQSLPRRCCPGEVRARGSSVSRIRRMSPPHPRAPQ